MPPAYVSDLELGRVGVVIRSVPKKTRTGTLSVQNVYFALAADGTYSKHDRRQAAYEAALCNPTAQIVNRKPLTFEAQTKLGRGDTVAG